MEKDPCDGVTNPVDGQPGETSEQQVIIAATSDNTIEIRTVQATEEEASGASHQQAGNGPELEVSTPMEIEIVTSATAENSVCGSEEVDAPPEVAPVAPLSEQQYIVETSINSVDGEGTVQTPIVMPMMHGHYCLICGDRGTGYHYTTYSCEGCKGFFKRSVQRNFTYTCKAGQGACIINKLTRNSCQFCRFKRCLEAGMKQDAVRDDRSPGGKHRVDRKARHSLQEPTSGPEDKFVDDIVAAAPDQYPRHDPEQEMTTAEQLMEYGHEELSMIVKWAKKLPGFGDIDPADQMAILKSSFMELNVLRLAYRSMHCDGGVKFAENLVLTVQQVEQLGFGKDLTLATLDFVTRLKHINLGRTDFCFLNAIVLTQPDAVGVRDKSKVTRLQANILDSFRKYILHVNSQNPSHYGRVLLRLPSLRSVSVKAAEKNVKLQTEGNILTNELVAEMMSS